jgi:hypothetical protein
MSPTAPAGDIAFTASLLSTRIIPKMTPGSIPASTPTVFAIFHASPHEIRRGWYANTTAWRRDEVSPDEAILTKPDGISKARRSTIGPSIEKNLREGPWPESGAA